MSVVFVGAIITQGAATVIPTHQAGDLMLVMAFNSAAAVRPANPTDWNAKGWAGLYASSNAQRPSAIAHIYKIAESSNETLGTWTNATSVIVAVYRHPTQYLVPVSVAGTFSGTSSLSWSAINTIASVNDTNWIYGFLGVNGDVIAAAAAPTGFTRRQLLNNASVGTVAVYDSNGYVDAFTARGVSSGSSTTAKYTVQGVIMEIGPKTAPPKRPRPIFTSGVIE